MRLVLFVLLGLCAFRAKAQEVQEAAALYLQPNFEDAEVIFESVLQKRALKRTEAATAHAYLATIHSAWGHALRAEQEAFAALTLDPNVAMPDGATGEVVRLFQDVRVRTGGRQLALEIAPEREPVQKKLKTRITARLVPFAELAASVLKLECTDGSHRAHAHGGPQGVTLELQPGDRIHCTATAENQSGALLVRSKQEIPIETSSLFRGTPHTQHDSSSARWWWMGTAIGVVVAATATTLAVVLTRSENSRTRIDETVIDGW